MAAAGAAAVLSLVALVALAAGPRAPRRPRRCLYLGGQGDGSAVGSSGVSKDAERVIQSAVRKAVAVRSRPTHPAHLRV